MIFVSFTAFQETYAPYILRQKARRLRHTTGDPRYQTALERLHGAQSTHPPFLSVLPAIGRALSRPIRLLAFHPIIQITAIISAFNYGILYIVLTSFSALWTNQYGESVEISGLHYLACALGEVAGSQIGGSLMDKLYLYMRRRSSEDGEHRPEFRIPLSFPGTLLASLGLFMYGWAAQYHTHWAVVDIGIVITMFGGQVSSMALQAYVIDIYHEHTGSALAAAQFLKSLSAFLFPLFAPSMYERLGYGWSNSLLGLAGLLIGLPAPLLLWRYGAHLRSRESSSY